MWVMTPMRMISSTSSGMEMMSSPRRYDGQIFVAVCGWYGLGRAWIEGLRTDSLYLPPIFGVELRVSQVLAIAIFALCLGIIIYNLIKKTDKPLYVKGPKGK